MHVPGTARYVSKLCVKLDPTCASPALRSTNLLPLLLLCCPAAKPVVVKRPILTSAVAYGPTTGQAIAAPAAGVTYTSWIFTATAPDGVKVSVQSLIPEARWGTTAATALRPNTKCELWIAAWVGWHGSVWPAGGKPVWRVLCGPALTLHAQSLTSLPHTSSSQPPCPAALPCADIVSVVGIQADGTPVAASNTLPMQTPPAK